jgi:hypothetical protein
MKRYNKNTKEFIFAVASPILSLVAFVVTYFIDPLKYAKGGELAAIPAFFVSIIVLIICHLIVVFQSSNRSAEEIKNIYDAVKNYLHVIELGTPKKAWDYIIQRLPVLEYVQNTSFNFNDENEQSSERLYEGINYIESSAKIAEAVETGLMWKDIGDSSAKERFEKIRGHLEEKRILGRYLYKFIEQHEPQIGFILLTYKDGTKEVLFNWDFRDIPQDPIVLLSQDQEIFNMFAAQYKGLSKVAVNDYDSMAVKSTS